jgi:hypothetical protein
MARFILAGAKGSFQVADPLRRIFCISRERNEAVGKMAFRK